MNMSLHIACLVSLAAFLSPLDCTASGQLNIPVTLHGLPLKSRNAGFECTVFDAAGRRVGSGGDFLFGIAGGTLETTVAVVIRRDNAAAGAPSRYGCGFTIYGGTEGERGTIGHGGTEQPMGFSVSSGRASARRPRLLGGLAWGLPGHPPLKEVTVVVMPLAGMTLNLFVEGSIPAYFIRSLADVERRSGSLCPCGCDKGGEDGAACTTDGPALPSFGEPTPPGGRRVATAPSTPPVAKDRASHIKPLSESLGIGQSTTAPALRAGAKSFIPQLTTVALVFTGTGRLSTEVPAELR